MNNWLEGFDLSLKRHDLIIILFGLAAYADEHDGDKEKEKNTDDFEVLSISTAAKLYFMRIILLLLPRYRHFN